MLKEIFACFAISTQIHTFPSCYKGHSVFEGGTSFLIPGPFCSHCCEGSKPLSVCCSGLTSAIKSVRQKSR